MTATPKNSGKQWSPEEDQRLRELDYGVLEPGGATCRNEAEGEEIMTLLTAAECREIAHRKMVEAEGNPLHGKEFRATAEAWLFLAEKIEQAETLEALKAKGK